MTKLQDRTGGADANYIHPNLTIIQIFRLLGENSL